MKKIKLVIIAFMSLAVFNACNDTLDINRDPDFLSPEQVPLNSEFPGATTGVAASAGSYYALIGGFWSQYFTQSAAANQYKTIDNYSIGVLDYNGAWDSMYDAILDLRNVKKNAESTGNWNYYLMSTVMEAYAFQILTDSYGAVPYKEAGNSAFLSPKFDQPEEIYDDLVLKLKDALSKDLSTSSTTVIPGNDDLVFGGNMGNWTKFANTMLLKLYMRQTNARPAVAQQGIQELMSSGAQFLTVNAAITQYVDEASKSNPLYESDRRQLNVGTNLRASTTLYSYLQDNGDPRFDKFYGPGPSQTQGDYDNSANQNAAVITLHATDPTYFISAAESYFLQAEAAARYGTGDAKALYDSGVMAAFQQWGLDGSAFVAGAYAYPNGTLNENLTAIITQKWISNFPGKGFDSFFEWKRTKIPAVSTLPQTDPSYVSGQFSYSVEGVTNGVFPRRIVYPTSESQYNINFPGVKPITEPLWYDAN